MGNNTDLLLGLGSVFGLGFRWDNPRVIRLYT